MHYHFLIQSNRSGKSNFPDIPKLLAGLHIVLSSHLPDQLLDAARDHGRAVQAEQRYVAGY